MGHIYFNDEAQAAPQVTDTPALSYGGSRWQGCTINLL